MFYESEAKRIAMLNEALEDVDLSRAEERTLIWLVGWEECTVVNVASVIRKVRETAAGKRLEQPFRP